MNYRSMVSMVTDQLLKQVFIYLAAPAEGGEKFTGSISRSSIVKYVRSLDYTQSQSCYAMKHVLI